LRILWICGFSIFAILHAIYPLGCNLVVWIFSDFDSNVNCCDMEKILVLYSNWNAWLHSQAFNMENIRQIVFYDLGGNYE